MKKKYVYIVVVLLTVTCLAAFGRIAHNGFINFDDPKYLTENLHIQSGLNFQNLKWAFSAVVVSNWHPLTMLSHMLDWTLFGNNAGGHHLMSLLFHIGAVIFLFLFLFKTTNNLWPAAFAAAFFALHPLRVESVAWASERKDVLSMFFGMAALYAYAFYAEKEKIARYLICLVLFALSLMSKPMLVTLPFVLLLLDYWPLKRLTVSGSFNDMLKKSGRLIKEKIPFFALAVASGIVTVWVQNKGGSVSSMDALPFLHRAQNAIVSYIAYLEKIFLPVNLAVFYPYELLLPTWKVIAALMVLLFITVSVIYYIRKLPFLFVGWFWYQGTLIPVIGLVQVGTQAMADRYTYLPSIGISIMLAWGIALFFTKKTSRKIILFPAAVAVVLILSALTWRQCGYWKNSITLYEHTLSVTRNNEKIHNNLGYVLLEKGDIHTSIEHFNAAIRLNPYHHGFYMNRGEALSKAGMYQGALEDFNKSISLKPDYADAWYNRGTLHGKLGNSQAALEDLNEAIRVQPQYAKAFNNRAIVYTNMGLYQTAIEDFNQVIRIMPGYNDALNNRAYAYLKQGDHRKGCGDAQLACQRGNCTALQYAHKNNLCS
jgi:tetratricopeptide (TPR) repeat protein